MSAIWDRLERKSHDEVTGLSRQRRWQLRQKAAGRCEKCGKPRGAKGTNVLCRRCANADKSRKKAA